MFPLRDDNPTELFPIVTLAIVAACSAVWVGVQGAGLDEGSFVRSVCSLGAIPAELAGSRGRAAPGGLGCDLGGRTWATLVTSVFLHGGWLHLVGNMWFLLIFGNNVEDSMGHLRFLVFYLLTGLVATGAHVVSDPSSTVPVVGASGAISAIMGAYLVLYPRARVQTLLVPVVFVTVVHLPAWVYLGYWFLLQVGGTLAQPAGQGGGVAFAAHVGGFVAGLVLVIPFRNRKLVDAKRAGVELPRSEIDRGGWW
jgi:membrane associated rhomboid family serine protease